MEYLELRLTIIPYQPWGSIITQELADIGFDSFMEEGEDLLAYIPSPSFKKEAFHEIITRYRAEKIQITTQINRIKEENWNSAWESDYEQVKIDKKLLIRAPFHKEDDSFAISLEIQPDMSFGTGHHPTTHLLCKQLLSMSLKGKKVLDVGTGTGVLGILASKLEASTILGTDIDTRAKENAIDNCQRNHISNFIIKEGDIPVVKEQGFAVIIANINRNILIHHLPYYSQLIEPGGQLLLSGFYKSDTEKLENSAKNHNFKLLTSLEEEDWCVLVFKKL